MFAFAITSRAFVSWKDDGPVDDFSPCYSFLSLSSSWATEDSMDSDFDRIRFLFVPVAVAAVCVARVCMYGSFLLL